MAAQDAELQLKVSLDLAFFKQQLTGLGAAAAGYQLPVNVKFDRLSVQNELNKLGENIRRRTYRLEVTTNLQSEIEKANKLRSLLAGMPAGKSGTAGTISRTAGAEARIKELTKFLKDPGKGGFNAEQIRALAQKAIDVGIGGIDPTKATGQLRKDLKEAFSNAGDNANRGLINALLDGKTDLGKAASGLGGSILSALKTSLKIQSPSRETRKIGKETVAGLEIELIKGLDRIENLTEGKVKGILQQLRQLTMIRGLMTGGISVEGMQAQQRNMAGFARMLMASAGSMAGIIKLPGGKEQRGRLSQTASPINTAMTGQSLLNIGERRAVISRQASSASAITPSFLSALPLIMGMGQTELSSRLSGLYGQKYKAPAVGRYTPSLSSQITAALSSTRGPIGTGGGLAGQLFASQLKQPQIASSGYIGKTAISPQYTNYPVGMPPAYAAKFAGGGAGSFDLSSPLSRRVNAISQTSLSLESLGKAIIRLGEVSKIAVPEGILQSASGRPRFKQFQPGMSLSDIRSQPFLGYSPRSITSNIAGGIFTPPVGSPDPWMGSWNRGFRQTGRNGPIMQTPAPAPGGSFLAASRRFTAISQGFSPSPGSSAFNFGGGGPGGPGGPGVPPSSPPTPPPPSGGQSTLSPAFRRGLGSLGGMNFPGTGIVKEMGDEFAFATKQVLLFGAAYKALAFIQNFPGQVASAVAQLQSFRNTLQAITPSANEAAKSNEFLLTIVDKYNLPLDAARDGFTKLYASMQPAGFNGDQIRGLFTGISKAAATFGMSADKVDRVNYAFAQMASKGQVMSEELKGQLGDVLPGAMAIFAQAAGFKGPDAIQKFSDALEKGRYKGAAMIALLNNVGIVMNSKFGPGAEGAAKTFQGATNRMQTSLALLYQSFEPIAAQFANTVTIPLSNNIKTIADAFDSFFSGKVAKTTAGGILAQQLNQLKPAFEGIRSNLQNLLPIFNAFIQTVGSLGKVFLQLAGNPITGYFLRVYATILPLVSIIKMLNLQAIIPMIASLVRAVPAFIAFNTALGQGTTMSRALQIAMASTGQTAGRTAAQVRLVGLALGTLGTSAILLGIGALIEKFIMLQSAVDGVRQSTQQMVASISSMANSGAVRELQNIAADTQKQIKTFEGLRQFVGGGALGTPQKGILTPEAAKVMKDIGMGSFIGKDIFGREYVADFVNASKIIEERLKGLRKQVGAVEEKLPLAERVSADIARQSKPEQQVGPIPPSTGEDKDAQRAADKAQREAEALARRNQQLTVQTAENANKLAEIEFNKKINMSDEEFRHKQELQDILHNRELSGLNEIQARQTKFAQDLEKIEMNRIATIRDARSKMEEASLKVQNAQRSAAAAAQAAVMEQQTTGVSMPTGGAVLPALRPARGSRFQGFEVTSLPGEPRAYRNGTHEGYDFATPIGTAISYAIGGIVKKIDRIGNSNAGKLIEVQLQNGIIGLSMHLSEVLVEAGQQFQAGQIIGKTGDTGAGPAHLHQESAPYAWRTGQAGASLPYLTLGRGRPGAAPAASSSPRVFSMQRTVQTEQNDLQQAQAQQQADLALQQLRIQNAIDKAYQETATTIKQNIDTIFPVAQQQLDLDLARQRYELQLKGVPQEAIDAAEVQLKTSIEQGYAEETLTRARAKAKADYEVYQKVQRDGQKLGVTDLIQMKSLEDEVKQYDQALAQLPSKQREFNINLLKTTIAAMENADAMKAISETYGRIESAVDGVTGTYKTFFKEVAMGGSSLDALKKAQEAIADQTLTMFMDFAMKPVEDFFKKTLSNLFGVPDEETQRKMALEYAKNQLAELQKANTTLVNIANGTPAAASSMTSLPIGVQVATQSMENYQQGFTNAATAVNNATAFTDSSLSNLADSIGKTGQDLSPQGSQGSKFQAALGQTVQGIGIAAASIMGIMAGINQIKEGGTSNVLGGIGSILLGVGGAIGGFSGLFPKKAANGAVWKGGFTAFANGGIVKGPTMGLVGEGRYNEAIVPLPDGKSIPVRLGGSSSREMLNGASMQQMSPPMLSMSFQTTKFGDKEYVDVGQLQAAMMETRKLAARDGANRGASLALDRLQNSPSVRRRVGMR